MKSLYGEGLMSSYEDYDETAKSYDLTRVPMGIDVILGALARAPCPLNVVSLLDAGCGTGSYSAALVDYVGRVSCVDLNQEMLAVAKGKLPVDVSIQQAAIDNLPFDDMVFDAIMINQVLHHVADDRKSGFSHNSLDTRRIYQGSSSREGVSVSTLAPMSSCTTAGGITN